MKCAKCGGNMVQDGMDAYHIYYRCVQCGNRVSIPKT